MPSHPKLTGLSLGRGVQTPEDMNDNSLLFYGVKRYSLRYAIG